MVENNDLPDEQGDNVIPPISPSPVEQHDLTRTVTSV